MYQVGAEGRL